MVGVSIASLFLYLTTWFPQHSRFRSPVRSSAAASVASQWRSDQHASNRPYRREVGESIGNAEASRRSDQALAESWLARRSVPPYLRDGRANIRCAWG